jgi:hypothetical protein
MPNVTITVPEELKTKMDKYSEVSWSEICRNAINEYIAQRENPAPSIELDIRDVRLELHHDSGYPTLTATLRVHNKMNTEIVIDRTLYKVRFEAREEGRQYIAGSGFDLNRRLIPSNSVGHAQIDLPMFRWKLEKLEGKFKSTFPCKIQCTIIANGFKQPYNQEVRTEIPLDRWQDFTRKALETSQATQ